MNSSRDIPLRDFKDLKDLPSRRLNDVVKVLEKGTSSILSLDALLPPGEIGEDVLYTLLNKIHPNIKVLSVRFNQLTPRAVEYLSDWLCSNNHLEMMYTMGSAIDDKMRAGIESSWKKNMTGHRTENFGYTFIRVSQAVAEQALKAAAEG